MTIDLGPLGQQTAFSTVLLAVGVLSLASVVYNVGRVLLSIFVLPGKPVSPNFLDMSQH